jgi:hypothetical protein
MDQRRTQFHDSKKSITRAETLLTGFKKEKVDYKKLDLQEAQSAFDSGDYESASNQANRVAEVAEIDLAELKKVKLERESLDGLLDTASKEGLNVDQSIIKGLNKSIKNCEFSNANKKIIELKESIGGELSDIRVVAAAPKEWKELEKIDKDAEIEDYYENEIWDVGGLRDDLKLMREKLGIKAKPSPQRSSKLRLIAATAPKEWKELEKIDKDAEVEDYYEKGIWDVGGLRDDLKLMRGKLGIKVKPSPAPKAVAPRKAVKKRKVRKKAKRPAAPLDKSGGTSKMQELRELLEMKKVGLINNDEFKQLKKEILG